MDSELERSVTAPPAIFNYAQHALDINGSRASKPAFIDDRNTLTYGQLDEKIRRMSAGLRALGVKRRERVLILMEDTTDWPVAFLGALHAGIVAVPVNTLLT